MTAAEPTLGQQWISQYLFGMAALHKLLRVERFNTPRTAPTPNGFTQILREIAKGTYKAAQYFDAGAGSTPAPTSRPPQLTPGNRYVLFTLNALTDTGSFVSVDAGGLIYEDPFWAILAAHGISSQPRLALPRAADNDELWRNVPAAAEAVSRGDYKPKMFLEPIKGFIPNNARPEFGLITLEAGQLDALRGEGLQTLAVTAPPKLYELYIAVKLRA